MKSNELTAAEAREFLIYDPDSGRITWAKSTNPKIRVGDEAGSINKTTGYRQIRFNGTLYQAYRLAYLFHFGEWLRSEIDHADRCKANK